MNNNAQLAVSRVTSDTVGFAVRRNSAGKDVGKRVTFHQRCTAGDIRRSLRDADPTLKGKKLTAEIDKVLRGDSAMPWVMLDAAVSYARSEGFIPVVGDLNKAGNKLVMKFERPSTVIDKETALVAVKQLSNDELQAEIDKRKAAAANQQSIDA